MPHLVPLPHGVVEFLLCCYVFSHTLTTCKSNKDVSEPLKSLQHVKIMDSTELESIRDSSTLSVVYFFTSVETPSRENFLQAFDNSAKYLENYNIALLVVNCVVSTNSLDECQGVNTIATYQNGVEFIKLDIDTMFDINSIMANSLQLLLLREVPIIESPSDRESLQASLLGKQDLIFFYTRAIGTMEHRVFMEIAFTYQDQYKFAVSTRLETTTGLSDEEKVEPDTKYALWTLHCSRTSQDPCQSVLYRGSLTLSTVADYMEQLPKPNLFYVPRLGTETSAEVGNKLPIIYIFTNNGLKQHSDEVAKALSYDVKGFATVFVVDVDHEEGHTIAQTQDFDGHVPRVAVSKTGGDLNVTFMEKQDQLSLTEIRHFLTTTATVPTKPGAEIVNATDGLTGRITEPEIHPVEVQDDEVAKAVFKSKDDKPETTHVPAVLKATFQRVVLEAKLKLVLYYLPYDAVSMAFLTHFDEAARILGSDKNIQDILAIVNCYDATDLCARENVATYPVVRIHKRNLPYQTYEGPLDTDSIVKAVGLLKHEFPRKLMDDGELNQYVVGNFPTDFTDLSPSSVLFVASEEDKVSLNLFRDASKRLSTFVAMGELHGNLVDVITKKYKCVAPCVVSFHHSDTVQPVKTMSRASDVDDIITFVKQAMIPTMPELTAANFPILHSKKLPFVILFLNQSDLQSDKVKMTFDRIASRDNFNDAIFCWMNAQNQTMGWELLKEYTQEVATPTIAVVNHKQAQVFTHSATTLQSDSVIQWLNDVFSGQEKPSRMLEDKKWSPPGPFFDFLKMIDQDLEESTSQQNEAGYDKPNPSAFTAHTQKETEVREKLMDRHRDQVSVDDKQAGSGERKDNTEAVVDQKRNGHGHEEL